MEKLSAQKVCALTNRTYLCNVQHIDYRCERSLHGDAGIFYACAYDIRYIVPPWQTVIECQHR